MSVEQQQEMQGQVAGAKTYAFVYEPGPQWVAGRSVVEQNLSAHRAYHGKLHAQGRLLWGGPFLDDGGGAFAVVRAQSLATLVRFLERNVASSPSHLPQGVR